jgi:isopenicillin N synthase-like dioxygenase
MPHRAAPIIDLGEFESGSRDTQQRIAEEVDQICRHTGFITLVGHRVNEQVMRTMWNTMHEFFDLPARQKLASEVLRPGYPYGYMGVTQETLAKSRGDATPPDLKETFNAGPLERDPSLTDPAAIEFCHVPTPWPTRPVGFRDAWAAYYREMEKLSARIMGMFATALNLPHDHFEEFLTYPISAMRALNYPPQQARPARDQLRAGAHSDYGSLTVLWPQDDSRGLEILGLDGDWHEVVPHDGALIINIGDLLQRWTNDRWRSTMHRVNNPSNLDDSGTRRQSIAYFHQPNWDARIACLPTCIGDGPRYAPVASGPYLVEKFRATVATS